MIQNDEKHPKNCLLVLILDSSPAYESESEVGLASPSPSLESGRTSEKFRTQLGQKNQRFIF